MVALGGGSIGDTKAPILWRSATTLAATYALDAPEAVRGIGGFRCISFYLLLDATDVAPMQAQLQVYWLWDETADPVTAGFLDVRRDAGFNVVIDNPLLPLVPANQTRRIVLPLANPGGAVAVAIALQDATGGGGETTQWVSAES